MSIKIIASVVIAALLMTGGATVATQVTEYGVQSEQVILQNEETVQEQLVTDVKVLTAAEAKAIALAHAGLTEVDVTGLKAEKDRDDGTVHWDVEFRGGDWEYDYEIHAESGKILWNEKEYDPVKKTETAAAPIETVPAETQPAVKEVTAAEAKAIALVHAGLTEADVTGLKAEKDRDDGTVHWDVEFRGGDWEYDYEIHAESGKILWNEKEYDSKEAVPTETVPVKPQPEAQKLTAEEAKAVALKHAGLTADQVKGLWAEYDRDDGIPQWEVEFYSGNMEYDYEIHAETGKILSWDKERDD